MDEILGHRPITQPRNVVDVAAADDRAADGGDGADPEPDDEEAGPELADISISSNSSDFNFTRRRRPHCIC
jgi:hypothetical protein